MKNITGPKANYMVFGGVRAALYSASFIIKSYLSNLLDIDTEEIELCNFQRAEIASNIYVGDITLSDRLQNGSGFASWINDNFEHILDDILHPKYASSFSSQLFSEKHANSCDSACYNCIMSYRNMHYHGLLDWRLGTSYLRVLQSSSYSCGLKEADYHYPEFTNIYGNDWLNFIYREAESYAFAFNGNVELRGKLPCIFTDSYSALVVHPLWDVNNPTGIFKEAINELKGDRDESPKFIDTFNLLRRPSWCHRTNENGNII